MKSAIIVLLFGSGCLLASEGRVMEADIRGLRSQLDAVKKGVDEDREALRGAIVRAEQKTGEVQAALDNLNNSARRNDADLGVQLDALQKTVQELAGRMEDVSYKVEKAPVTPVAVAADSPAAPSGVAPSLAPPEPKVSLPGDKKQAVEMVQKLLSAKEEKKREEGKRLAGDLLAKWPKDEGTTDVVRLSLGDRFAEDKLYQKAILEYKKVFDTFRKGARADTAMFKIAQTMMHMGYQEDARVWFEELLKTYPKSELVKETKLRLSDLEKQKNAKKPAPVAGKKK